ncbi:hypothetical protein [Mycobacteroides chelonae]|nr:hypothetical protein [Mycobacteroides chelonae]
MGRSVVVVDQNNAANLGGQASWFIRVLFLGDMPEQCRPSIKDS